MKDQLIQLFNQYPNAAFVISIFINVVIAVLGVIPSVFITAANIIFFGFWKGTLISLAGEVIGAAVSFFIYRKGFKKASQKGLDKYPKVKKLVDAKGSEAFLLILSLRLIPFVPSGLVTFAAAIGVVSEATFVLASSLGKIPALLIEAYSVYQVTQFGPQGKIILAVTAIGLLYYVIKKVLKKKKIESQVK